MYSAMGLQWAVEGITSLGACLQSSVQGESVARRSGDVESSFSFMAAKGHFRSTFASQAKCQSEKFLQSLQDPDPLPPRAARAENERPPLGEHFVHVKVLASRHRREIAVNQVIQAINRARNAREAPQDCCCRGPHGHQHFDSWEQYRSNPCYGIVGM